MPHMDDLKKQVERQARRMKKAERERPTLIGQTIYIGQPSRGLLRSLVCQPDIGGCICWRDECLSVHKGMTGY